jgi:hypothetical protein
MMSQSFASVMGLYTIIILGFSNCTSWLDGYVWPHHMYILTKGQGLERHGHLLTIQFDCDD